MFGIQSTKKPDSVVATVLTYWVFQCRDRGQSPAMGMKTWEYLASSIKNAAIPANSIDDYINYLAKKLVVKSLRPIVLEKIISPSTVVLRQNAETGEILQFDQDQYDALKITGWEDVLNHFAPEGLTDRKVIKLCKEQPLLIATHVRLKYENDKLTIPNLEEYIDVDSAEL